LKKKKIFQESILFLTVRKLNKF